MSVFQAAVRVVLENEGGFQDNPDDAGNWTGGQKGIGELRGTNFGISAKSYPTLDIKNLTVDEAIEIYKTDYWNKNGYARILDQIITTKLFDMAVNMGAQRAQKCLQRALWASNPNEWCNVIVDDGVLGNFSINAINSATASQLLCAFRSECAAYYRMIVALQPHNDMYLKGWLHRSYS